MRMCSCSQCNVVSIKLENLVKRGRSCRSLLLPRRWCNFLGSTIIIAPLFLAQRCFHSGLDERRVQRLRRSGMTFNKPRGRDTLSSSFQSRIRLRAFAGMNDMYSVFSNHFPTSSCTSSQASGMFESQKVINRSPLLSTEKNRFYSPTVDPWSSTGNAVRLRHAAEGDIQSQKIIISRAKEEEVARRKKDRHIAVVDLLPSTGMRLQVTSSFPISAYSSSGTSITSSRQECEIIHDATHMEMVSMSVSPSSTPVQECSLKNVVHGSAYTTLSKVATLGFASAVPGTNAVTQTVSFFPPPIFFPQPHPLYYFSFFEPQTPKKHSSNDKENTASRFLCQGASTTSSTSGNSSFFSSFSSTLKKGCAPLERIQFELPSWSIEGGFPNLREQKPNSLSLSDDCKNSSNGKAKGVIYAQPEHEELCKRSQGGCEKPPPKDSSLPTSLRFERFHPFSFNLFSAAQRRNLQKNGDAILLPVCWTRSRTSVAASNSTDAVKEESLSEHFYLIPCVEPLIEKPEYGREEAQVEMITAYRNILQECAELLHYEKEEDDPVFDENDDSSIEQNGCNTSRTKQWESSSLLSSSDSINDPASRIKQRRTSSQRRIDILRIPALCISSSHRWLEDGDLTQDKGRTSLFQHEIGELNYEALLKGFHRLAPECKEALLNNPNFSVELFVPVPLFNYFVKVFSSEAWEVSSSTLRPGRTSLYPGLAPPPSLQAMEGWVGKRPELEAGEAQKGKFLLKGPFYQLDGKPVEAKEVWTEIKVFGSAEEEKQRLLREKQTYLETQNNHISNK